MRSQLRCIAYATVVQWLVLLLLANSAMAEPSTPLADPSGFSGNQVLIDFDGLGLIEGDPVPPASGVTFMMSDGRPAFSTIALRENSAPTSPAALPTSGCPPFPIPTSS